MADGMTLKQAMDQLLRAERGVGWCLRTSQLIEDSPPDAGTGPVGVTLHVFPILDQELSIDGTTLPANSEEMDVDTSTDPAVLVCDVGREQGEQYGYVIAYGEQMLSCFSVSVADGTLEADWTPAEESDYKAVATRAVARDDADYDGPPPEVDDFDQLRHVYCQYRLPWEWDGQAGNGMGGPKSLVIPKLDSDGVFTTQPSPLNRMQRGFDEFLPIPSQQRPSDAAYNPAAQNRYLKAFAVVRWTKDVESGSSDRWAYVHAMPPTSYFDHIGSDVDLLHDRHAVSLSPPAPHLMANSPGWIEPIDNFIKRSNVPATYAWQEVIATVSLRTDERLYAYRVMEGASGSRVLYIEVPDAELWRVAGGTVVGLNGDGTLKHAATPYKTRDDSPKLAQIADMAAAWYGVPRNACKLGGVDSKGASWWAGMCDPRCTSAARLSTCRSRVSVMISKIARRPSRRIIGNWISRRSCECAPALRERWRAW
jgi:hypothetical protein